MSEVAHLDVLGRDDFRKMSARLDAWHPRWVNRRTNL